MDRTIQIVLLLALSTVNCGVVPAPKVLEGPSSKTTLIGPDGSKISAFAPGGKIVLDENPGPVLQGAPEVVAVAGVAQPPVEVPKEVVEEIIDIKPVVETSEETIPEITEDVEISRSAVTENSGQVEASPISIPVSTEQHAAEAQSESSDLLENSTGSSIEEKVTENPFSVIPLKKDLAPIAVKVGQPVVAYVQDFPESSEFDGRYVPENLFEKEILGW